jgi:hypothetical protein
MGDGMPVIERDPTEEGMARVVADAEAGRLSIDTAERMMAYLKASPHNPPRTYADAYYYVVVLCAR